MSRRLHSATVMGVDVVIFGGISMEDNSDLNDLCYLTKVNLACMCACAGVWMSSSACPMLTKCQGQQMSDLGGPGSSEWFCIFTDMQAAGGYTWSTPTSVEGFVRQSKPDQPAALPVERSAHTAVAIDTDLLTFSGEANGELIDELCMVDTEKRVSCNLLWPGLLSAIRLTCMSALPRLSSVLLHLQALDCCDAGAAGCCSLQATAKWQEPALKGLIPRPRKGACAAATQGHFVVMFGGKSLNAEGKEVMMDELLLWDLDGPNSVTVSLMAAVGKKPAPRVGGTFQVGLVTCH